MEPLFVKPMSVKVFFFDCGGVLAKDMPWNLIERCVSEPFIQSVRDIIRSEWDKMKVDDQYNESSFWEAVKEAGHLDFSSEKMEALRLEICENITACWPVIDLAEKLKNDGFHIGIISNHSKFWFDYIKEKFHFNKLFPEKLVIPSSDVSCAKPSTEIYRIAFERAKEVDPSITNPSEIVLIDDKKINLESAAKFGFVCIQFRNFAEDASILSEKVKELLLRESQ